MKLFRLRGAISPKHSYMEFSGLDTDTEEEMFDGKLIKSINIDDKVIKRKSYKNPDVYDNSHTEFYVSKAVKEILEKIEDNSKLNFIETTINNEKFWFLNILETLDCFDWNKSTYTSYSNPKAIKEVTKLEFISKVIGNRKIFRIKYIETDIFVTEDLKNELEHHNFSGLTFVDGKNISIE